MGQPGNHLEDDLRLVPDLGGIAGAGYRRPAWIVSAGLHLAGLAVLLLLPKEAFQPAPRPIEYRRSASLVAPPKELTQTAPNRGKPAKEVDLQSLLPRPRVEIPPAPRGGRTMVIPPVRAKAEPKRMPALPEPPKVDTGARTVGPPPVGSPDALAQLQAPPPQIEAMEKPRLPVETPGERRAAGLGRTGQIATPNTSVDEAVRSLARSGSPGTIIVGDVGGGGLGGGISMTPAPGRTGSSLELLSDPQGVDFRPYLIRILATVKRNWLSVIPESARLGRQGRVAIQFAIDKDGQVPKLVIAIPSGTDALDRAAVAGISASNPFPPLPSEFKGNQVRLQFTFLYNMR